MHSNKYIFFYAVGISIFTAVLLAFASQTLKPYQDANIKLDTKTSILRSVHELAEERKEIETIYSRQVEEFIINTKGDVIEGKAIESIVLKKELDKPVEDRQLPLYVHTDKDEKKQYIIPMRGKGLWGPIFGYLSLEDDFSTVYGAYFTHKAETPGLGAEIAEPPFQEQFKEKQMLDDKAQFVSVHVVKKGAKSPYGNQHRVDGISGGTITSNGVDKMLKDCVGPYMAYFEKLKSAS